MRTFLIVTVSALLLTALTTVLVTQLSPFFSVQDNLSYLLIAFLAFMLNGLFVVRVASSALAKSARQPNRRRERSRRQGGKPRGARKQSAGKREEGTIKWFDHEKRFGFIIRESGEEIFVHLRQVNLNGENRRAKLRDGQKVSFRVVEGTKGPQAEEVTVS